MREREHEHTHQSTTPSAAQVGGGAGPGDGDGSGSHGTAMPARPSMSVDILRHDPLVLAVKDFLSKDEIAEIVRIGTPLLQRSK